jgi:hypothetical protein
MSSLSDATEQNFALLWDDKLVIDKRPLDGFEGTVQRKDKTRPRVMLSCIAVSGSAGISKSGVQPGLISLESLDPASGQDVCSGVQTPLISRSGPVIRVSYSIERAWTSLRLFDRARRTWYCSTGKALTYLVAAGAFLLLERGCGDLSGGSWDSAKLDNCMSGNGYYYMSATDQMSASLSGLSMFLLEGIPRSLRRGFRLLGCGSGGGRGTGLMADFPCAAVILLEQCLSSLNQAVFVISELGRICHPWMRRGLGSIVTCPRQLMSGMIQRGPSCDRPSCDSAGPARLVSSGGGIADPLDTVFHPRQAQVWLLSPSTGPAVQLCVHPPSTGPVLLPMPSILERACSTDR